MAVEQLDFGLQDLTHSVGGDVGFEWAPPEPLELGAAAEHAVEGLAQALEDGDRPAVEIALARLTAAATDLWQPLTAAGLLDPPGAAPGFNFRYEVLLAARLARRAPVVRQATAISDVPAYARIIAGERAKQVSDLADADVRARAASQGLYDETYFVLLEQELGSHLEAALSGSSDTLADLIETAWQRSQESGIRSDAGRSLELKAIGVGTRQVGIEFFLSSPRPVTAAVYNSAGRWVAALHDGVLPAGFHHLTVDLSRSRVAASGVYFMRLQAGDRVGTLKLPLLN